MKIDSIYIPCTKGDFRLTRICVASIRYWYPDIPITLVKDLIYGDFDTSELEQHFNVKVYPQKARVYGWGFSKFEVFMEPGRKRFLMLDSDIVLVGPILDVLEPYDEDWIVFDEPFNTADLYKWYFDPAKIKLLDPEWEYPNYHFNTGQLVGTTDTLKKADFDRWIEWGEPRIQRHREAFTFGGEQPLLNYLIMKKSAKGELTSRRLNFMREGKNPDTHAVSLERVQKKEGYPFIIHWHDGKPGVMRPKMDLMPRADILLFFEDMYFRKLGYSKMAQSIRVQKEYLKDQLRIKVGNMLRSNENLKKTVKKMIGR